MDHRIFYEGCPEARLGMGEAVKEIELEDALRLSAFAVVFFMLWR